MFYSIAIDGPAGAGKSTIAKLAAKAMGFVYVDTGAMYRAIALYFLKNNVELTEEADIIAACASINIGICYKEGAQQVVLNGENVSGLIRTEAVGNMASKASSLLPVREKLLSLQREQAEKANVIMDGRDIGTEVLPNAYLKIFLTASKEERASRRFKELSAKGESCTYADILRDIAERDSRDMNREHSPLKQAEDAVFIDSSNMSIDEVAEMIKSLFLERVNK